MDSPQCYRPKFILHQSEIFACWFRYNLTLPATYLQLGEKSLQIDFGFLCIQYLFIIFLYIYYKILSRHLCHLFIKGWFTFIIKNAGRAKLQNRLTIKPICENEISRSFVGRLNKYCWRISALVQAFHKKNHGTFGSWNFNLVTGMEEFLIHFCVEISFSLFRLMALKSHNSNKH